MLRRGYTSEQFCTLKEDFMKPETKVFIAAQLLDIATTLLGIIFLGHGEWGLITLAFLPLGWPVAILVKVFTITGVAYILQRFERKSKFVWIIPGISIAVLIWNITWNVIKIFTFFV